MNITTNIDDISDSDDDEQKNVVFEWRQVIPPVINSQTKDMFKEWWVTGLDPRDMKLRAGRGGYRCPPSMYGKTIFETKAEYYNGLLRKDPGLKELWERILPSYHDKFLEIQQLHAVDFKAAPAGNKPKRNLPKYTIVKESDMVQTVN